MVNPVFLRGTGLILYTQPLPKSGFWITSLLAAALGLTLAFSSRLWARRLFLSLALSAILLFLADSLLRLWPPLEITGASNSPEIAEPNSWGFFDTEPKLAARYRILVLGDSITWGIGEGLGATNRYHDRLQADLAGKGLQVDVQNTAYPGWSFEQYLRLYSEYAPKLDPQLVIIGWCMNDIDYGQEEPGQRSEKQAAEPLSIRLRRLLGPPARALRVSEWFLWTLASRRAGTLAKRWGWTDRDWLDDHNTTYRRYVRQWWTGRERTERLRTDLRRLAGEAAAEGRSLLLVIFPLRYQVVRGEEREIAIFRSMLHELGIPYVDLYPAFAREQLRQELYSFRDETHPTAEGHRLAARLVLPEVERLLARQVAAKEER